MNTHFILFLFLPLPLFLYGHPFKYINPSYFDPPPYNLIRNFHCVCHPYNLVSRSGCSEQNSIKEQQQKYPPLRPTVVTATERSKLFQEIVDRVADVGHTYIIRDLLSSIFTDNEQTRVYAGSLSALGMTALLLHKLANSTELKGYHPVTSQVLRDMGDLTGVGVGIAGFSYDLRTLIVGSQCLRGTSGRDCTEFSRKVSGSSQFNFDLWLDVLGSGLAIINDILSFIFEWAGPYTAVLEGVWTLGVEIYKRNYVHNVEEEDGQSFEEI